MLKTKGNYRIILLAAVLLLPILLQSQGAVALDENSIYLYETNTSDSDSEEPLDIDMLTSAVIRAESVESPFDPVEPPQPSIGVFLVPANTLSLDLVNVAFSIRTDSGEKKTLENLAAFDKENLVIHPTVHYWQSPTVFVSRKDSAQEMFAWRDFKGNITGNCYSHASFNTAVLRLMGFPPEQVFSISVAWDTSGGGHVVTLVKADGRWYVVDSTQSTPAYPVGGSDNITDDDTIYTYYGVEYLRGIENDKYYANFNRPGSSNIPESILQEVLEEALPMLGDPNLGYPPSYQSISVFASTAEPVEQMVDVALPYTVYDFSSAETLVAKNLDFIRKTAAEHPESQYMKALSAICPREERFYHIYANAAKYGTWAQHYGIELNMNLINESANNVFELFNPFAIVNIVNEGEVTYGDFPLIVKGGNSLDQAVSAYGIMRNTKDSQGDYVSPELLRILMDEQEEAYLAVKVSGDHWVYMDFSNKEITSESPALISYSFNERGGSRGWDAEATPEDISLPVEHPDDAEPEDQPGILNGDEEGIPEQPKDNTSISKSTQDITRYAVPGLLVLVLLVAAVFILKKK